ncbi:PAS domain S-box protein, partial [bacterium]|nr:PAS domain S-box protein [bacterium]
MKYKLQDLIDMEHFQNLQDRLDEIYSFPSSIIDNDGNILTATAWQDICTQFHRKNKDCEKLCIKSDQYIKDHILEANPAVSYRCPHGLVDNATPIIIDGFHYGNFFTGQFFLEEPDMEFFRTQAKKYGFDEDSYLKAVKRVPIWTQEKLNSYLFFIKGLITIISESGLKKLKETENRKLIEAGENRHRSIIKSAMDGYWLTDTDGRLLEVNEAYCRMSGYSEDELLKMSIPDLEANEDSQLAAEHMQKVIFQGSDRFESKHRSKDGTVFNIEVSTQFRPEEGGQCVCFLRDITERKQAEKSIRISEKKYRTLFENMTQGVFYQRADGVLIEYNNATLEMFGLTSDQFIGRTSFDPQWKVITEDGTVLTVDKHPSMVALQTGKPVRDAIVGVYNPLKKYYNWLIVNAIPQFNKAGEKPYQVFVTLQDITERKKAESDLFQQKQFLQKAQEIGKIGTWELDIQKNELLWTDENYKIFGIPIGTKLTYEIFLECVHPDDREYVDTEWKAAFTGKPYDIVHRLIVDGKTKWVREKAEIIFNELGGCIKGTGFTQDITGQKKSEIEKIKEKQKAENYLNMAGVMFVGLDKDGNINLANKKACQILDGQQEEILGLNWFDNFIPQHIRHEVHSVYEKLINGNIKPVEYYENLI